MTVLRPIVDVAAELGLASDHLVSYGPHIAKIGLPGLAALDGREGRGRIVLVSAITPTKAGEGKTTVAIGLSDGMRRRGAKVAVALRQPSLGPIFGSKGGATGGGHARVQPSTKINMHFTGDLHAVTAAHNLLAALADQALHLGALDSRSLTWHRVVDMNDRALRKIIVGLGGREGGVPRESRFDITAASEVMAVLCLARGLADLKARLGRILVGLDGKRHPVNAAALQAAGAMTALLRDALLPNLVQTAEGTPAFVHGGPFANIAHGCSSVSATLAASAAADYVVTEAGFGFDLGGEKFLDIKCRSAGIWPSAVVLVVTARALRQHGLENLDAHLRAARSFGLTPVVAINRFPEDSDDDLAAVERACEAREAACARAMPFSEGGAGCEALADKVLAAARGAQGAPRFTYDLEDPPEEKLAKLARGIYGATDVVFTKEARTGLERAAALGLSHLPVCVAKTHMALLDTPPVLTVREVRISAGAGFLLAVTGEIMTMPGLPNQPAAQRIDVTDDGEITGV